MIQAALSPVAVFCLFGIFYETTALTTQVSKILNSIHAYSQKTLNRLRSDDLRQLVGRVYAALSGNTDDECVRELCELGANYRVSKLYQTDTRVVVGHSPFKDREDVIESHVRIEFKVVNWAEDDVEIPLPFQTTISWETVPDDETPVFELESFMVHLEGDAEPTLSLTGDDIVHKKMKSPATSCMGPREGTSFPLAGRRMSGTTRSAESRTTTSTSTMLVTDP